MYAVSDTDETYAEGAGNGGPTASRRAAGKHAPAPGVSRAEKAKATRRLNLRAKMTPAEKRAQSRKEGRAKAAAAAAAAPAKKATRKAPPRRAGKAAAAPAAAPVAAAKKVRPAPPRRAKKEAAPVAKKAPAKKRRG